MEVSVIAPVAGANPAMTATTTTENVQPNPACCWYPLDENGNIIISGMLGEDDTFEAGKNYYIRLFLSADTGYAFANPVTIATINGDDATIELNNDGYLGIKKSFVASGITTYTISFDANGGIGTMADVTGVSGSKREKRSYSNRWVQDTRGWWYRNPNGTWPSNGWAYLPWNGSNYWYYFDADGYMVTSWLDWQGNRYYLNPIPGTNSGRMLTVWQLIDG